MDEMILGHHGEDPELPINFGYTCPQVCGDLRYTFVIRQFLSGKWVFEMSAHDDDNDYPKVKEYEVTNRIMTMQIRDDLLTVPDPYIFLAKLRLEQLKARGA
jgi:hypothetical protein